MHSSASQSHLRNAMKTVMAFTRNCKQAEHVKIAVARHHR